MTTATQRKLTVVGIVLIALLAASVRIAYVIHDQSFRNLAALEMERAAISLAREGSIAHIYSDATGKSAHVSPLYALFLAGLYSVFGWNTSAGRLAQELCAIAATTAGIALLPVAARSARLSSTAGWVAALTMAVLPFNLWVETSGSWEQPFAALATLGFVFLFGRLEDDEWKNGGLVLLTGGFVGLVALMSPVLLPAAALMIAAGFVRQAGNRRRVLVGGLAIALAAGLVVTPWVVRNFVALGGFVPLRSNFGLELAIGNHPLSNGKTCSTDWTDPANPFYELHPFSSAAERDRLLSMGELAYMRDKKDSTIRWMAAHPARTFELTMLRFRIYWLPTADAWSSTSRAREIKAFVFALAGAGALFGLVWLVIARHPRALLLAAAVIGPSLIYMVTHVDMRYRYPTFGLTVLLTAELLVVALRRINLQLRDLMPRFRPMVPRGS